MGKLTGLEIYKQVKEGRIVIDPFDENRLNPNSYNVQLAPTLKVYNPNSRRWHNGQMEKCVILDAKKENETYTVDIPETGVCLQPGTLYLGRTVERTQTNHYVPIIDGRSSNGRLGIVIHATAGFGDIGFDGTWTLEIFVIHPTIIYPYMEIGQVSFEEPIGDTSYQYKGRYLGQTDVTASRSFEDKKGTFKDFIKERGDNYGL